MLLNCHTYFSFGYGTLSIEELLEEVKSKGYKKCIVTDINNTSACIDSVRLGKKYELDIGIGIDFRNGIDQVYIGIAHNNRGFQELNIHLSNHLHSGELFQSKAPELEHAHIVYPFKKYKGWDLNENEYIGISHHELLQIPFSTAKNCMDKMVILEPLTFIQKKHFNAHRLLRAIHENKLLSKLGQEEQAKPTEIALMQDELIQKFKDYPIILKNTEKILEQSEVDFEFGKFANKNLKYYTSNLQEDMALLRAECAKGILYRFTNPSKEVNERIEKELSVIEQMGFASYFLINWDIIQYAQHKNYFYIGRGSGANSLIAYLLRITNVDPIELDLYFERFINPFRSNPPDFDMDFSWTDRDDITRYIFDRFGRDRTALLATYSTFQHDSVSRELGKVFGLPPNEIDKLQKLKSFNDADSMGKLVLQYSHLLQGLPNHLSIHSSGIIISEKPISSYTATFMPPKGYPTTQFSMLEAEDIGLYKFDILSQRGLGKIKDAAEMVKTNHHVKINLDDIALFKNDKKVKALLSVGKCIGCFYIESPAMRMLLAKLKASDYLSLVAASSIIRPGVSKSGMMREYILRFRNLEIREKAQKAIPVLYKILEETYGVMVYQEDVIKVAHFFAGLTLAEADYLRRGMSWKFKQRNEFDVVKDNFYKNCLERNYSQKVIDDIWTQIESFANYAFSKGHSASYAVESYQALYLKAYYPLEYMTATINNGGGFYRTEIYLHEARMHGGIIEAPCINHSEESAILKGNQIYLSLNALAEIEHHSVKTILIERQKNGLFLSLSDFIKRVFISAEQLRILIRIGAFRFTKRSKKELLWDALMILNPLRTQSHLNELFEIEPKKHQLPTLTYHLIDDAFDEIELLGYALCSPFDLVKHPMPFDQFLAKDLKNNIGKTVEIYGYLVTNKRTATSKGERMSFGTFLDYEGNWIDTVHFPPSLKQSPYTGIGCYWIKGKVVDEFDFTSIEVSEMKRMEMVNKDN